MGKKHTIVINGRTYDAITGLAVSEKGANHTAKNNAPSAKTKPASSAQKAVVKDVGSAKPKTTAKNIHRRTQRSKTLKRTALKKPTPAKSHKIPVSSSSKKYARSPQITKFAKHPEVAHKKASETSVPKKEIATKKPAQKKPVQAVSSRAIKEQLIREQMEKAPAARVTIEKVRKTKAKDVSPSKLRTASVITVCLSLLALAGYLTYLSMPNLSMRIAAMQTGVNAKLPEYQPQGYALSGPVTYDDNKVTADYKAQFGGQEYTITQTSSEWDSRATLDNFVAKDSSDDYQIRSKQGLTIYTYGNKAVWVNGGVLHVLKSNSAPLTSQQIERIAVSM